MLIQPDGIDNIPLGNCRFKWKQIFDSVSIAGVPGVFTAWPAFEVSVVLPDRLFMLITAKFVLGFSKKRYTLKNIPRITISSGSAQKSSHGRIFCCCIMSFVRRLLRRPLYLFAHPSAACQQFWPVWIHNISCSWIYRYTLLDYSASDCSRLYTEFL